MKIQDQTARTVQSDIDLHFPKSSLTYRSVMVEKEKTIYSSKHERGGLVKCEF